MRVRKAVGRAGATLLSAATLVMLTAPGVQADDDLIRPQRTVLKLSVYPSSTTGIDARPLRTATLTCDPDGGTHPGPREACALLARVGGDFTRLDLGLTPCPRIYQPVTAVEEGTWQGRRVAYRKVYSNECVLLSATGPVFKF